VPELQRQVRSCDGASTLRSMVNKFNFGVIQVQPTGSGEISAVPAQGLHSAWTVDSLSGASVIR
jgi:hypothetical protein